MAKNSTNINKTNNHLSRSFTEHKKDYIWHWKSRPWLGTGRKMWQGYTVNGIPTLP